MSRVPRQLEFVELSRGIGCKTDVIDAAAVASVAALHGGATTGIAEDHTNGVPVARGAASGPCSATGASREPAACRAPRSDTRRCCPGDHCEVRSDSAAESPAERTRRQLAHASSCANSALSMRTWPTSRKR